MNYITIKNEKNETYSSVSNFFIDYYMTSANGEFVKVYLYLIRLLSSRQPVSVADIADHFNLTEKDICRAIRYWISQDVLRLEYNADKELTGITLLPLREKKDELIPKDMDSLSLLESSYSHSAGAGSHGKSAKKRNSADRHTAYAKPTSADTSDEKTPPAQSAPDKLAITPELLRKKQEDAVLSDIIFETETYYGRPLSLTEMQSLIYIYDQLGFSEKLTEYVIEYSIEKGKTSMRYAEAVARSWYEKGIRTVDEAKACGSAYNSLYRRVFKALGIRREQPTGIEAAYIESWEKDMKFSEELILLACRKAVLSKPQSVNFAYVNGILENWHKNGVKSVRDVEKLDQEFIKKKADATSRSAASRNPNGFADFTQSDTSDQLDELAVMLADELNRG